MKRSDLTNFDPDTPLEKLGWAREMQGTPSSPRAPGRCVCELCALSVGTPRRTAVVITGGWCVAQKKGTYIQRIPPPMEKK